MILTWCRRHPALCALLLTILLSWRRYSHYRHDVSLGSTSHVIDEPNEGFLSLKLHAQVFFFSLCIMAMVWVWSHHPNNRFISPGMTHTPLTDATDRRNKRISRSTGLRIGLELFAIFAYRKFALPLLIPCSDEGTQRPSYCSTLQARIQSVLGTAWTEIVLSQPGLSLIAAWQVLRYGREFIDALPYVFFSEEEIEVITEMRRKRRQVDKIHEDVQSNDKEESDSRDGDDGSEDSGADGDGEEDEADDSDDSSDRENFMDRVLNGGNTMPIPDEPNIRKIGCILQDITTGALSVRSYIPHAISTPQILLSSDEHDDLAYQEEELAISRHGCED
ncbi:MAG: hypothetical protein Q9183_005908, partial [Haloplaca sp. 2 TL-2023]